MKLVPMILVALFAVGLAVSAVAQDMPDASGQVMEEAKRQYRSGNFRAAVDTLNRVTVEAPDRADAFYLLGYAHLMLREFPESLDAFSRAFALDPTLDPRSIYQRRAPEGNPPTE